MLKKIIKICLSVLWLCPSFFILFLGVKVAKIKSGRLGHLVGETHCVLRDPFIRENGKSIVFVLNKNKLANRCYVEMLRNKHLGMTFILPEFLFTIFRPLAFACIDVDSYCTSSENPNRIYSIEATQNSAFSEKDLPKLAKEQLENFRIGQMLENFDNMVLVHFRTPHFSPSDDYQHSGRNVDATNYIEAIQYLCDTGHFVVRMGDYDCDLSFSHASYFDYASSHYKTDELDLALASVCKFMISCSSGPVLLASIFGRPVLGVNLALPFCFSPTGRPNEIGMPKLMTKKSTGEILSLEEIAKHNFHKIRNDQKLNELGLSLKENTGEEIKDAVQEMLLFLSKNNLDDIGYLSAREKIVFALESPVDVGSTSKPSMSFLNRHQSLLTLQEN